MFDYEKYIFGEPGEYNFIDNCLIYKHSSVQMMYKDKIEESINKLKEENLSNIDTIIIDLRGNIGGNSNLNKFLIDFLKEHLDKKLICLTDYRVFSAGRWALLDLINLGAITIGDEIGTPLNCYGNNANIRIDEHSFAISEKYFQPFYQITDILTKESFNKIMTKELLKPVMFKPDILVKQTKEDYLDNVDTILEYALEYSKQKNLKM